ncbi:MAG TPA: rRNA maturation RNase YbeY [Polyangia bacterium]
MSSPRADAKKGLRASRLESARPRLTVEVRGRARRRVRSWTRRELGRRLRLAMRLAGIRGELALSLADDAELLALNRQFAGEDHATDVLSFSQREGQGAAQPAANDGPLGDIIISVETAARQAESGGRTLLAELFHLAVHGLAHLIGYDHATAAEEKVMFGWEARLRARVSARRSRTR